LFFPGQVAVAFFSALMMLYAGSLTFLNMFQGIPALYAKYIMGQEVFAPFKFVSDAIIGEYTTPVINSVVTQHWGAMAFALMMAVVYLYFRLLQDTDTTDMLRRAAAFFVGGFLFALLAIVSEPYFAVLCTVLFLFPLISFFFQKDWIKTKKVFATSFFLLLVALLGAFFQGGLLRSAVTQQLHLSSDTDAYDSVLSISNQNELNNHSNFFKIGTPWLLNDGKPVYNPRFLAEFALLLAMLVPIMVFLFKRRFQLALFLTILLLLLFLIPLFVDSDFPDLVGQLGRFFLPIPLFGGLTIGLVLAILYQRAQKPRLKGVLLFLALILMAQGLWTHFFWLAFGDPPVTWNPNAVYFAQAGTREADAYSWIKKNTTIKDLFLIIRDTYTDCGASSVPNCLFILNTGRMAPIFVLDTVEGIDGDSNAKTSLPGKVALFSEVRKSCDPDIVRKLNYNYLYTDERWSKGMEEKCLKNNKLNLVFQTSEGKKSIRIYKIEK